jgi:hypothetical protein
MPDPDEDAAERLNAALDRQSAVWQQMTDRSGPVYDTAKERSRAVADAYRAAGSPARVTTGPQPLLYGPLKARGEQIPATPAQAAAWRAWTAERERLRRELRYGKPAYVDATTAKNMLGVEDEDA